VKIIRDYVLGEVFSNFWMTLCFLTFILLVGDLFSKMIDLIINHGVDITRMVQIFILSIPFLATFTIPMAALVAVLLAFGRLSADHETTALRASGVSLGRIVTPILLIAAVMSLLAFYLNDQIASKSHYRVRQISSEIGLKTPTALLEEGVFIKRFKDIVIFIHRIDGNKLKQVRIYQPQENGPTRTIIAEEGEIVPIPDQNIIKLKLINGISDEPDTNNPERFYKLKFGTYYLPLDISNFKYKNILEKKRKELTTGELWRHYKQLKAEGFVDNYALTAINNKIAISLSPFVLVLLSIPLGIRAHRREKSFGFAIALLLGTLYWALSIGASSLAKMGTMPPVAIMHIPNLLFLLTGAFMLRRIVRL